MARKILVLGSLLFLVFSSTGCSILQPVSSTVIGKMREKKEKCLDAADYYLKALEAWPRFKPPQQGLLRVGECGYQVHLTEAESLENQQKWAEAKVAYDATGDYLDLLKKHGALSFETIDVRQKQTIMANSAAEEAYQAATTLLEQGRFEESIQKHREAQSHVAKYKDTSDQIALSFYRWGDAEVREHKFRSAASHFEEASTEVGQPYQDANQRAGRIYLRLGQHFYKNNLCRQAVRDLRKAHKLTPSDALTGELGKAEVCAQDRVLLANFTNNGQKKTIGSTNISESLTEQVRAQVRSKASEFFVLVSSSDKPRYTIRGKLTTVDVNKSGPSSQSKTTTGNQPYSCTKTKKDGTKYTTTCYKEVSLSYTERSAKLELKIEGTLTVLNAQGGELLNKTIDAVESDSIHYVDNFKLDGTVVSVGCENSAKHIAVPSSVCALLDGNKDLKSEEELAISALKELSDETTSGIFSVLDKEPSASDPTDLDLN